MSCAAWITFEIASTVGSADASLLLLLSCIPTLPCPRPKTSCGAPLTCVLFRAMVSPARVIMTLRAGRPIGVRLIEPELASTLTSPWRNHAKRGSTTSA